MRVSRIRIIAWGIALLLLALLVARGPSVNSSATTARRESQASARSTQPVPRMLEVDQSANLLTTTPSADAQERLVEPAALRSVQARDPKSQTKSVIREPGMTPKGEELKPAPGYAISEESEPSPPTRLPLDLFLTGPEEAEVAPRASQNITSDAARPKTSAEPTAASEPPALPMLSGTGPAMEPVNDLAREHVQRGFSLGERSATYAARTEFIQALRTIAQAVDAQAGLAPKNPQSCSQALVRGLHALTEADDFAPSGSRLDGDLDLTGIMAAHRTPLGKRELPVSQLAALQAYFDFARNELIRASAGNQVASQALTGLGKTYTLASDKSTHGLSAAKATVFHQAAVAADPRNHLAANELGVLMAKHSQWEPAKASFLQSLRVQRDAATWQNLAAVHAKLGEQDLARLAETERQLLLQSKSPNLYSPVDGSPTVQWVDPKAFAGPPEEMQPQPASVTPSQKPAAPAMAKKPAASGSWLPWR